MRRALLLTAFVLATRLLAAQPVEVAPVAGAALVLDEGAHLGDALGADASLALSPHWGLGLGARTVDAPAGRLALADLAGRHSVRLGDAALTLQAGALLARQSGTWAGGPHLGLALDVPLTPHAALTVSTTARGLVRDGGLDGLVEATAGVRLAPFGRACAAPQVHAVAAPQSLLPGQPARFEASVRGRAERVRWTFGDDSTVDGPVVDRVFTEVGVVAWRVAAEGCGGVHVAQGTVQVAPLCTAPPRVSVEASPSGRTVPGAPVQLRAVSTGTPPLRYSWRHVGGTDTTRTLTVAYATPGLYAVDLDVTGCAGTATARGLVQVDSVGAPVTARFGFGRCDTQEPDGPRAGPSVEDLLNPAVLAGFALRLRQQPEALLLIEGYADTTNASFNDALSWGRAILVERHIRERLSAVAHRLVYVGRGAPPSPNARLVKVRIAAPPEVADALARPQLNGLGTPTSGGDARECPPSVQSGVWTEGVRPVSPL